MDEIDKKSTTINWAGQISQTYISAVVQEKEVSFEPPSPPMTEFEEP